MPRTIPSIAECLDLMERYTMLPNIRQHSFVVARVAERILARLADTVDNSHLPAGNLVTAGALLHDIAKTQCIRDGGDHCRVGAQICTHHGFTELAEIVGEHVRLRHYDRKRYNKGIFEAKELVFYADKRVVHDQIVSLKERLEYILRRYGNNDPVKLALIRENFENCRKLEESICHTAGLSPNLLLQDLSITPYVAGNQ